MKSVGILANSVGDPYSLKLLQAVSYELAQQSTHAVCFMGGFPQAPLYHSDAGKLALPSAFDAWILFAATMRATPSEYAELAQSARACVSVGLELPDTPSLTSSDETGIFQAVAHLARRHERRRIAFVAGPTASTDSTRRLTAYRMAIESVGLTLDPALIADGDYEARSGREAVWQLDRQAKRYDAVVAANDLMAVGVIDGLRAKGQRVPEDVSVIGFDDMEEASFSSPTLTTVRQPLHDLGSSGVRLLLRHAAGASVEPHTVVTAPLVIRESCGCRPSPEPDGRSVPPGVAAVSTQGLRESALRELVRRELANSRRGRELAQLGEAILGATEHSDLAEPLTEVCRLLRARRMAVATYSGAQRHARMTLESSGKSVVFLQQTQPFALDKILPAGFLREEQATEVAVLPLELGGEQFGYVAIETSFQNAGTLLDLRRLLSAACARITQARELRRLYTSEKKKA